MGNPMHEHHDHGHTHAGHDGHHGAHEAHEPSGQAAPDAHEGHHTNAGPHEQHAAGGPADHSRHGNHTEHDHSGHDDHSGHHGGHDHGPATWKMSALATAHCLTGCAIGEILGLAIGTALGWGNMETIVAAVALAFLFGYGLTLFGIRKAGLSFGAMIKVALAADTVSIIVMEIIDNAFMMLYPGAMDAGLGDGLFWGTLAAAFALAFAVTTPVNKALISAGKGHAVVHGMH
ncbi:DUF4396 domain-containing protein [Embleya sp. NPDC005575]|uniref:DUF4396 domain-containing protein n=1 Tax=Embleya sp. NPDC005575 TaxID=3156892 RepID=UPI0033B79D88